MEKSSKPQPQTRIDRDHLAKLQALESASRIVVGPLLDNLSMPARVMIDFDPWVLCLDMTAKKLSMTGLYALCHTGSMPRDAGKLLTPGDSCRIMFDSGEIPLPLIHARIETVAPEASAPDGVALRFKWLFDHSTESQFRKFLEALTNEKGRSLS
jgi:hypothetical protein